MESGTGPEQLISERATERLIDDGNPEPRVERLTVELAANGYRAAGAAHVAAHTGRYRPRGSPRSARVQVLPRKHTPAHNRPGGPGSVGLRHTSARIPVTGAPAANAKAPAPTPGWWEASH
jgi:hypothetical protein